MPLLGSVCAFTTHLTRAFGAEMSAVENTSASRLALARARALYRGDSAYRSETGGLMSAIRKLTVDKGA